MQKISFGNFGKILDFIAKGKVWRLAKNRLMRILGDIMVIRMRHTRAHTGNRRSHHALKANTIVNDAETGTSHLRHRVNMETGMYRGRQVIDVTKKALKNAKKSR